MSDQENLNARKNIQDGGADEVSEEGRAASEELAATQNIRKFVPAKVGTTRTLPPEMQPGTAESTIAHGTRSKQEEEFPPLRGYEFLGLLGRGAMGVVFKARHIDLDQLRAVKVLPPRVGDPDSLARFRQEMRVLAHLEAHPGIVPVYEAGVLDGRPYFVMPLIHGGSLEDHLERYQQDQSSAVQLVEKVALAVDFAHNQGVVHRDIKPANILLTEAGEPCVADFGVAKRLAIPASFEAHPVSAELSEGDLEATRGHWPTQRYVVGTLPYLAPECCWGNSSGATPAGDVWSLGVLLYQLLTREYPFVGASVDDMIRAFEDTPEVSFDGLAVKIPPQLQQIVRKCLNYDPSLRYDSAADLASDLAIWRQSASASGQPKRFRRLQWFVGSTLALGALTTGVWLWGGWKQRNTDSGSASDKTIPYFTKTDQLLDRLRQSKKIDLIAPDGQLPTSRVQFGSVKASVVNSPDGKGKAVQFAARGAALVELLPRVPGGRYRIETRLCQSVRHSRIPGKAQAGPYWAYHQQQVKRYGVLRFYLGLTFYQDSLGARFGSPVRTLKPQLKFWFLGDHPTVPYERVRNWANLVGPRSLLGNRQQQFEEIAPHDFRTLAVEVRGRSAVASWDGAPLLVSRTRPTDFDKIEKAWGGDYPVLKRSYPELKVVPCHFVPEGAIGLFLSDSTIVVHSYRIQRLP